MGLKQYENVTADRAPTTAALSQQPVDLRHLSWAASLVRDYCHDFQRLDPFFAGSPSTPAAWQNAIATRRARRNPHAAIADVTTSQLLARQAPPEARAAAAKLRAPETMAIVTGQQAGLFGGPLFTLLKALTAIKLASDLQKDHGVETVAVFWVDAEDHDLAEISTCGVLTDALEHKTVTLPPPTRTGIPAFDVRLPDAITDTIAELRSVMPATEYSDSVYAQLTDAYRPGVGIVDAFARWLDHLLGRHGLVVFDASDRSAKPLVRDLFGRELDDVGETSRLATASGAELTRLGYHAQVTPSADAVALFYLDGQRVPIRAQPDSLTVDVGSQTMPLDELRREVQTRPDAFSPNVLLRPVVQDALFPTVAYVAGPSELAYLGQLRHIYERFAIPMPLVYPRLSATIVDRATVKFLSRYDVAFEQLQTRDDRVLNDLLASLLPTSVDQAVSDAERAVAERLTVVGDEVATVDTTLTGVVETTRRKMERELKTLRNKIVQAAKRRDETLRRQFERARAQAFPQGTPQERAVGMVYFLNRYGPHLVDRLLADLPVALGQHWVVTV